MAQYTFAVTDINKGTIVVTADTIAAAMIAARTAYTAGKITWTSSSSSLSNA